MATVTLAPHAPSLQIAGALFVLATLEYGALALFCAFMVIVRFLLEAI